MLLVLFSFAKLSNPRLIIYGHVVIALYWMVAAWFFKRRMGLGLVSFVGLHGTTGLYHLNLYLNIRDGVDPVIVAAAWLAVLAFSTGGLLLAALSTRMRCVSYAILVVSSFAASASDPSAVRWLFFYMVSSIGPVVFVFFSDREMMHSGYLDFRKRRLEKAREARIQAEKALLAKELGMAAAAAKLLGSAESELELAGFRIAAPRGERGVLWWAEAAADGSLRIFLARVEGSPMRAELVLATLIGAHRTLSRLLGPERRTSDLLKALGRSMAGLARDGMAIALAALELTGDQCRHWPGAGIEVDVVPRNSSRQSAPLSPTPFTEPEFAGRFEVLPLGEGARLVASTGPGGPSLVVAKAPKTRSEMGVSA